MSEYVVDTETLVPKLFLASPPFLKSFRRDNLDFLGAGNLAVFCS